MGYSVKVKFPQDNSLEVSADTLPELVLLTNALTRKFFSGTPAVGFELVP